MKKKINERSLKINGKVNFEEKIDVEKELFISGVFAVDGFNYDNNNDGTYNKTYKGKFLRGIEIKEGQRRIQCKDNRKISQKFRGAVYHLQNQKGMTHIDKEEFYQSVGKMVIRHLDLIYDEYWDKEF